MTAAPSPASTDVDEIAAQLRTAIVRLNRQLRQQDRGGLTPTMGGALATLVREGALTLGALAEHEQLTPPTITKVVERLEAEGYLRRTTDERDRRVCRVQATAKGKRYIEANRLRRNAWIADQLRELDPAEVAQVGQVAQLLEAIARRR